MSIVSTGFIVFSFITVIVYYCIPKKDRWIWLLLCSSFFYFSHGIEICIWVIVYTLLVYLFGIFIQKNRSLAESKKNDNKIQRGELIDKQNKKESKNLLNMILFWGVLILLVLWFAFRFCNKILDMYAYVFSVDLEGISNLIIAPLGVSFFTLSSISYLVDIKRRKITAEKNVFKLMLWLFYFPQSFQGPIVRFKETYHSLITGNDYCFKNVIFGIELMIWGYFKKLVVSNYSKIIVDNIFESRHLGFELFVGIFLYSVQLYCDFSGGIDIISGFSQTLGVVLPINFRRPYFSKSITEYWNRWHITLGAWFKDYIFTPIAVSSWAAKVSKKTRGILGAKLGNILPTYVALSIVWLCNGIWHGAGLNYIIYGLYQGLLIILELQVFKKMGEIVDKHTSISRQCFSWKLFQICRTFFLVSFGRIIYLSDSLREALIKYKDMFSVFNPWIFFDGTIERYGLTGKQLHLLIYSLIILIVISIVQERIKKNNKDGGIREFVYNQNLFFRAMAIVLPIIFILVFGMYGNGVSANEFIYMKY